MIGLGLSLWPRGVSGGVPPPAVDEILLENDDKLLLETGLSVVMGTGIPAQSAAAALVGSEYVAVVQGGTTKRLRVDILATYLQVN
jgi:hypothetical protein